MSWLTNLFRSLRRLILGESETEQYLRRWVSENGRVEVLSKGREDKAAIATFVVRNKTDGTGEIFIYLDLITELIKEINARKLKQGAAFRHKPYELELFDSRKAQLSHRLSIFHVYPIAGAESQKKQHIRLRYIIDADWSGEPYDRSTQICQGVALSFLDKSLPSHFSDWSKFVLDPYATDWLYLIDYKAKQVYGERYKSHPVFRYKSR